MAAHAFHDRNMLRVHAVERRLRERTEKFAIGSGCQQQILLVLLLHGAVVGKGSGIEPHAVKPDLSGFQLPDPLTQLIPVEAGRKKSV